MQASRLPMAADAVIGRRFRFVRSSQLRVDRDARFVDLRSITATVKCRDNVAIADISFNVWRLGVNPIGIALEGEKIIIHDIDAWCALSFDDPRFYGEYGSLEINLPFPLPYDLVGGGEIMKMENSSRRLLMVLSGVRGGLGSGAAAGTGLLGLGIGGLVTTHFECVPKVYSYGCNHRLCRDASSTAVRPGSDASEMPSGGDPFGDPGVDGHQGAGVGGH